jgi:hypothetical protein
MANGLAPKHLMPPESAEWDATQIQDWRIREALRWGPCTHPVEQTSLWFPFAIYDWQAEALKASARPHSRVVISTCNEAGKTSLLIPVFGLSCMTAFPGATIYSTSASERQVKYQLFEDQLRAIVEKDHMQKAGWSIRVGTDMIVKAPNGSTWLGYVCKDAGNVEGFHGKWRLIDGVERYCPCIYINDESKNISDDIRKAEKRIDPDFELSVSSPGEESGWFYEGVDPDTLRVEMKV